MSPDNSSTTNQPNRKTSERIEDLNAKKVAASDANKVKGGFNPQPDPPAKSDRGKGA